MMKICMVRLGKVMQLTNRTTIIYSSIIAASQKKPSVMRPYKRPFQIAGLCNVRNGHYSTFWLCTWYALMNSGSVMQGNSFRCIRRHVSTLITFGNECFMTCIGRPFWPFFLMMLLKNVLTKKEMSFVSKY